MSIDLGDAPVGTPPTTGEQTQIRSALLASGYVQHGTIAYVTVDGDDLTGTINRADLPFATPQAALQALFEVRFLELAPYYDEEGYEISTPPAPSPKLLFIGVGEFGGIDLDSVDTTNADLIFITNSFTTDLLFHGITICGYNPYACRLGGITASFEVGLRGDRSVNLGDLDCSAVGMVNVVFRDAATVGIINLVQATARDISSSADSIYLQSDCIIQSATAADTVYGDYTDLVFIGQDWYYES